MISKNIFTPIKTLLDKIPTRFNVGFMFFMACFISYMLRTNISVIILAMIKPRNVNGNSTTKVDDYGPRYSWSNKDESLILGAYFWGYLVTNLLGGVLSERYGGAHVIGLSALLSGIVTGFTPLLANENFWYVWATRFVLGVLGGVVYPALHNLVSKWAPPDEKGKFVAGLLGGAFGTVVTWMITGVIIETFGWDWAFYVSTIFALVFVAFWYYLVSDNPECHPRIKPEEVQYIENSFKDSVSKTKKMVPIGKMLISLPFYALLLLHYGSLWGLYFLMTAAPKFMNEALGFNLSEAGILSSLPYLARLLCGFGFGAIGDYIRTRDSFQVTTIRKFFCIFSHIIPGLFLISMRAVAFDPYICVAVITMSLGFNGAATLTNLQNAQDLAPNFAGSIYGVINFVGTTSGFISPMIVAAITNEKSTVDEWQYVFYIGATAYIVPGIIFMIFGSGKIQKWNEIEEKTETDPENSKVQ